MKVSVIIPAHNEEKYIEKALQALMQQDFPNEEFEVIVVDNASTDRTQQIARQFSNRWSRVRVVVEERKGILFARECGRLAAKGEILACMDADCLPPKDWLKRAVPYFHRADVVGVTGPYDYYDADWTVRTLTLFSGKILLRFTHMVVHHLFHIGGVMLGGNSFIRASALEKAGGFNTSLIFYGEDTDTALRLNSVGTILFRSDVVMRTSARRTKRIGTVRLFYRYVINFMWVLVFKRPFHPEDD